MEDLYVRLTSGTAIRTKTHSYLNTRSEIQNAVAQGKWFVITVGGVSYSINPAHLEFVSNGLNDSCAT